MVAEKKLEMRKGTCCSCSRGGCHVRAYVDNGRVVKVTADPDSPAKLCVRASASVDYHHHPERLNYPMRRTGKRGEGKWERITWEQAMDEIAQKLDSIRVRFGPEAVAVLGGGNPNPSDPAAWRWCNLWGTPNYFWQGKNCGEAEFLAECAIYGTVTLSHGIRKGTSESLIMIWGANPYESRENSVWPFLSEARKRGSKLVVIDPRRSRSAAAADMWIQLRPGTDGALALGMLNVIINEDLYDKEFVDKWCIGFDELKLLVQNYPPERVESITWVPKEQIVEAARLYANSKPACLTFGVATGQLGRGATLSAVAGKCLLRAITGNLDIDGGQPFIENPERTAFLQELHWDKLINHPLRKRDNVSAHVWPIASVRGLKLFLEAQSKVYPKGLGIQSYFLYPASHFLWKAIMEDEPYPLRAVFLQTSNPLVVLGNAKYIYSALKSDNLELFVALEHWMTPSAQLADYILPAADALERPYLDTASMWGFSNTSKARERAVEPLYERRDDYYTWRDLGCRLGQAEYWPETVEHWFDKLLAPTDVNFNELASGEAKMTSSREYRSYEKNGFPTFSGKVELTSSLFERVGLPGLPDYEEPPWSPVSTPELAKEYPFILITGGRVRMFYHTQHRHIQKLRRMRPSPLVEIHPQTAKKLGIANGVPVYIETPLGKVRQIANLTTGIDPRVVHADAFWWYPELPAEDPCLFGVWDSNINAILPDDPEMCDYTGDNPFRALLCKIYRAKEL